jgi:hypothetical protein
MRKNIKLRKARIEAEHEEWKKNHAEKYAGFSEAQKKQIERIHKKNMKALLTLTDEEFQGYEEINRMTSDPNFDERTFEEEHFGGPFDDDDCYSERGYYVYADRYDEAAKQRPPVRKNRPQMAMQMPPEPVQTEPRAAAHEPKETMACAV